MAPLKNLILMLILAILSMLLAASENNQKDLIRKKIYAKQSFAQAELRQMAGFALLLNPLISVWGAMHYSNRMPNFLQKPPYHVIPSKKIGLRYMLTGTLLAAPACIMMAKIEQQVEQEMVSKN